MAQQVGTVLERALVPADEKRDAMASMKPSTDTLDLTTLPKRLDDAMLGRVKAIASAPVPTFESCPREVFLQHMKALATMPRQNDDHRRASLRLELYWQRLGHYPAEAWQYMVSKALDTRDFMPTIAACREILETWPGPSRAAHRKAHASRLVTDELQARHRDLMVAIARGKLSHEQIQALGERKCRSLETEGVLRATFDEDLQRNVWTPFAEDDLPIWLQLELGLHRRDEEKVAQ